MTTLDEITKEKQRLSEALARVDAQHEKLISQLSELEAAERVLARYSKGASPSLGDQVLALAIGKTRQEIAAACKGARPNHIGVVLARHKRAGRIEERDGKLYATQSAGMEQRAAV